MKSGNSYARQAWYSVNLLAIGWISGIFLIFFIYPPYWALMDDASYWYLAKGGFENMNFIEWLAYFTHHDFSWGMFRPLYAIFIYGFYGSFWQSSALAYSFIFIINLSVFWIWSILFEKSLLQAFRLNSSQETKIYRTLFFIFCFLFSPNYTLFFFASLQERLVLIFGSISLLAMLNIHGGRASFLRSSALMLVGVISALLSKATALFFIPYYILWLLALGIAKRKWFYGWLAGLLCLLIVGAGLFFLSIRKGYTADYQIMTLTSNFFHGGKRFYTPFWFACAVLLIIAVYYLLRSKEVKWIDLFPLLVWPAALLSYLVIMAPWRSAINYYLIVPGGIFWTGCKLLPIFLVLLWFPERWRRIILIIVVMVSAGVSIPSMRKFVMSAKQHHITGQVVTFLKDEVDRNGKDQVLIRMPPPCLEATRSMGLFLSGSTDFVTMLDGNDLVYDPLSNSKKKLLILNGECNDIPAQFSPRKLIFKESPWEIYELADRL